MQRDEGAVRDSKKEGTGLKRGWHREWRRGDSVLRSGEGERDKKWRSGRGRSDRKRRQS